MAGVTKQTRQKRQKGKQEGRETESGREKGTGEERGRQSGKGERRQNGSQAGRRSVTIEKPAATNASRLGLGRKRKRSEPKGRTATPDTAESRQRRGG